MEIIQNKLGEDTVRLFSGICQCFKRQGPVCKKDSLSVVLPDSGNIRISALTGDRPPVCLTNGELETEGKNGHERAVDVPRLMKPHAVREKPGSQKATEYRMSNQSPSSERTALSTRIFYCFWLLGECLFYTIAIVSFLRSSLLSAVLFLSASATGFKTIAWYLHTALSDHHLLPVSCTPKRERRRRMAFIGVKIGMSWLIALGEYIPLTLANRTADMVRRSLNVQSTDKSRSF